MAELGVLEHPVQKFGPVFGPIDSTLKLLPIVDDYRGSRHPAPQLRGHVFQFAAPNDATNDAARAWRENRPLRPNGQLTISGRSPDEMHRQNSVFDPTRLAPGIEQSDDPVLAFRPRAYAVSDKRRLGP